MAELTSLREAIAATVRDGDTVALEGFTHLIPFAAGHEIIRQQRRDLTLIRMTPDLIYDQMIGMGTAAKLVFSWGGNPGVGSLHRFRDAVEAGWPRPLETEEHSHAAMANAWAAGASGLPFAAFRGYLGTSLPEVNPSIKTVTCPFTGEELAAVPALRPDVGIIHAQRADRSGNVLVEGIVGVQKEVVLAAARSVVTVEEVVDAPRPTQPQQRRPPHLDDRHGGCGPGRGRSLVRPRLLPARQRLLPGLGCHFPPPRRLPRLDGGERARNMSDATPDEMMTIVAARALADDDVCFVGIGAPSAACNLARLTHAPRITLIYESGTIGTKPEVLPLSIGDGELAETSLTTVSVPEMFRYWLQGGRISVGFLGAAQLDRFGNINTTVIGDYHQPKVRLPGGGGAPEIATSCGQVFVTMRHTAKSMVERVDFVTSLGFGPTGVERTALGVSTRGPTLVITDLCTLTPDAESNELVVDALHPGVGRSDVEAATGWDVRFSADLGETEAPTNEELSVLRLLHERTEQAHRGGPG